MAKSRDIELLTRQSTNGGSNLGQHWRGERNIKSKSLIEKGGFDGVVLQDHSMRTIQFQDSLRIFGALFNELIVNKGAKTFLYMTWAREWDPFMIDQIAEQYTQLATQINAQLVPVGLAWQKSRMLRPNLQLFDPDGSHPSPTGTYLSACVFFGAITGESPIGLPHRIISEDKDGEVLYINIQSQEDALFCQKVAEEVLVSLPKK